MLPVAAALPNSETKAKGFPLVWTFIFRLPAFMLHSHHTSVQSTMIDGLNFWIVELSVLNIVSYFVLQRGRGRVHVDSK